MPKPASVRGDDAYCDRPGCGQHLGSYHDMPGGARWFELLPQFIREKNATDIETWVVPRRNKLRDGRRAARRGIGQQLQTTQPPINVVCPACNWVWKIA